jgi:GNAT superfamily N-acetyltransferase
METNLTRVREALRGDLSVLSMLHREFKEEYAELDRGYALSEDADRIFDDFMQGQVGRDDIWLTVGTIRAEVVSYGFAQIRKASPIYAMRDVGYLSNFYVRPAFRGHGLAQEHFDDLVRWMRERGVKALDLSCDRRVDALDYWFKKGFYERSLNMRLDL